MTRPPNKVTKLSETLTLCEYEKPHGYAGFWLYDKTRGANLSMRAKTETAAFVEALTYYQKRLAKVESEYKVLSAKVDAFVAQFTDEGDEE